MVAQFLVDDREQGRFLVNRHSMTDREVLIREYEQVFDRCWLYVGHESELAGPHDTRTRTVARRPIIFCRDGEGRVRVFLNSCPHRGNVLCRDEHTTGRTMRCFFHGWTFGSDGRLVSLADEEGYGPFFDRSRYSLATPPHVDAYAGFVFISFDPAATSLAEYLADAKPYLDLVAARGLDEGMEVVGGVQRYSIRANWKLLAENSVDSYHALYTHKRWFDLLKATGSDALARAAQSVSEVRELGNGHVVTRAAVLDADAAAIESAEAGRRRRIAERLGPEWADMLRSTRALLIFPNLVVIDLPPAITIRTFEPEAVDVMRVSAFPLAPRDDEPEHRQRRLDFYSAFWGPAGMGTPDDVEALEGCQRGFATVRELEWSDISRGMHNEHPRGVDELQMRTFWRRWNELMTDEPYVAERP
jgi:benzoate/toluate 1,2-dioxygenase alpha subunit